MIVSAFALLAYHFWAQEHAVFVKYRQIAAEFLGVAPAEVGWQKRGKSARVSIDFRPWIIRRWGRNSPQVSVTTLGDYVCSYLDTKRDVPGQLVVNSEEAAAVAKRFVEDHWNVSSLEVRRVAWNTSGMPGPDGKLFRFADVSLWRSAPKPQPNSFLVYLKKHNGQVFFAKASHFGK